MLAKRSRRIAVRRTIVTGEYRVEFSVDIRRYLEAFISKGEQLLLKRAREELGLSRETHLREAFGIIPRICPCVGSGPPCPTASNCTARSLDSPQECPPHDCYVKFTIARTQSISNARENIMYIYVQLAVNFDADFRKLRDSAYCNGS